MLESGIHQRFYRPGLNHMITPAPTLCKFKEKALVLCHLIALEHLDNHFSDLSKYKNVMFRYSKVHKS